MHKLKDSSVKPIAHASRTPFPAENDYSEIEKEGYGLVFVFKQFHRFIHRRFTL